MNKKYYIVNDEIFKSLNFIHLLLSIIRGIIYAGDDMFKLYDYDGKKLTKTEIARLVGVSDNSLAHYLNENDDNIEVAVKKAIEGSKNHFARNIEYEGEMYSMRGLAKKFDISPRTLKKYYEQTNDIKEALKIAKEKSESHFVRAFYQGKERLVTEIANMNDINYTSLSTTYKKTKDIEEAIEICKKNKEIRNNFVEYYGEMLTFTEIAKRETIAINTLKRYYNSFDNNIYKAVMICKNMKRKDKKVMVDGIETTVDNLSKNYSVSNAKMLKMLDKAETIDNIEKKTFGSNYEYVMYKGKTLRKYCLENSYNYSVILYMVNKFGITPQQAIDDYIKNGQSMPTHYIYEKYNVLLRHLFLKYKIDFYQVTKFVKKYDISLNDAMKRYIFMTNNDNYDYNQNIIDWLMELYEYFEASTNEEEKEEIKKEFFVTDDELKFIEEKKQKINFIDRQFLLYEFSFVLDWDINMLYEMLSLYNITEDEIITIVCDLYFPFDKKIINPTQGFEDKQNSIRNIILDKTISLQEISNDDNLTNEEKENILKKREKLIILNNYIDNIKNKKNNQKDPKF